MLFHVLKIQDLLKYYIMFISFFSSFPKRWFYRLAAQEAQIFMLQMANEPLQRLIEASINIRPQFFLSCRGVFRCIYDQTFCRNC